MMIYFELFLILSFQRAKIRENCIFTHDHTKKARPKAGFFNLKVMKSYSSTTKFFTSHVAEAEAVLVYLKAMVTVWPT